MRLNLSQTDQELDAELQKAEQQARRNRVRETLIAMAGWVLGVIVAFLIVGLIAIAIIARFQSGGTDGIAKAIGGALGFVIIALVLGAINALRNKG